MTPTRDVGDRNDENPRTENIRHRLCRSRYGTPGRCGASVIGSGLWNTASTLFPWRSFTNARVVARRSTGSRRRARRGRSRPRRARPRRTRPPLRGRPRRTRRARRSSPGTLRRSRSHPDPRRPYEMQFGSSYSSSIPSGASAAVYEPPARREVLHDEQDVVDDDQPLGHALLISRPGLRWPEHPRCERMRAMTHSVGDLAEVLDNLGVFSMHPEEVLALCPSGFRRVPITQGDEFYLSLQGFTANQPAYAHTHPDSEEWVVVLAGAGKALLRRQPGAPRRQPRDRPRDRAPARLPQRGRPDDPPLDPAPPAVRSPRRPGTSPARRPTRSIAPPAAPAAGATAAAGTA